MSEEPLTAPARRSIKRNLPLTTGALASTVKKNSPETWLISYRHETDNSDNRSYRAPTNKTDNDEVSREEKMALRGTDPDSYITEYTLVYEEKRQGGLAGEGAGMLRSCPTFNP